MLLRFFNCTELPPLPPKISLSRTQYSIADETFQDIQAQTIGERIPNRGVSSFKFIPGHPNEVVALKSIERDGITKTHAFWFDLQGNILSDEICLGGYKCGGVEMI